MGDEIIRSKRDPRKDKLNSYANDCRNTYGASPHAARKAVPKRKAMAHRQVRHATKQDLSTMDLDSEESVDLAQSNATSDAHRVGTWKKQPDTPLGEQVQIAKVLKEGEQGKLDRDEVADEFNRIRDAGHRRTIHY